MLTFCFTARETEVQRGKLACPGPRVEKVGNGILTLSPLTSFAKTTSVFYMAIICI